MSSGAHIQTSVKALAVSAGVRAPTGRTRLLGVVGDPVVQVRAPELWTSLFLVNDIDTICIPLHLRPNDFAQFLAAAATISNLDGLIVTVPHKIAARDHTQHASARAARVGVVNALRHDRDGWHGDIVDGVGFVAALISAGHRTVESRVVIAGAGGVGRAIAFALADAGAGEIGVADVVEGRAADLVRDLTITGTKAYVSKASAAGADIIVNASPVGMAADDPLPFDCSDLQPGTVVCDVVAHPPVTDLLRTARAKGCEVQNGAAMMDHQIEHLAEFFGYTDGDWGAKSIAALGIP